MDKQPTQLELLISILGGSLLGGLVKAINTELIRPGFNKWFFFGTLITSALMAAFIVGALSSIIPPKPILMASLGGMIGSLSTQTIDKIIIGILRKYLDFRENNS